MFWLQVPNFRDRSLKGPGHHRVSKRSLSSCEGREISKRQRKTHREEAAGWTIPIPISAPRALISGPVPPRTLKMLAAPSLRNQLYRLGGGKPQTARPAGF